MQDTQSQQLYVQIGNSCRKSESILKLVLCLCSSHDAGGHQRSCNGKACQYWALYHQWAPFCTNACAPFFKIFMDYDNTDVAHTLPHDGYAWMPSCLWGMVQPQC